jgi:autotransporter-associated beta strand protein
LLTIATSGYTLSGNQIKLSHGITAGYSSGKTADHIDTVLLDGNISVGPGAELDLLGTVSGTAGLTVSGGGTLILGGTTVNSYSGTTTVNAGTLVLSKANNFVAVPGDVVVGDGTDTALVQETASNEIASTAVVSINALGTLDLNDNNNTISSLTFTGGSVTTETGVLTLGGDVTSNSSSTLASIRGNLELGNTTRTFSVADPTPPNPTDLKITAAITGSGGITKTGAGRLDLGSNSSYTGPTTINAGTVSITDSNALGNTSGVTIASGAELDISGGIDAGAPFTSVQGTGVAGGGAIVNLSDTNSLTGPITLAGGTAIVVSAGQLTLAGPIGDGGNAYALTKVGSGVLEFDQPNTYTGNTSVEAGTLKLASAGAAIASALTIDASTSGSTTVIDRAANQLTPATTDVTLIGSGATFDLNKFNDAAKSLTFTGGSVSTGAGTLTLGAGGVTTNADSTTATIRGNLAFGAAETFTIASGTVPGGGPDLSVSAIVSDGGNNYGLTKAGPGILALSGTNTYGGNTTINAGVLAVSNSNALGNGTRDRPRRARSGGHDRGRQRSDAEFTRKRDREREWRQPG